MQFINPAQLTIKRECWKALLFFIPFLIARKVVRGVSSGGAGGGGVVCKAVFLPASEFQTKGFSHLLIQFASEIANILKRHFA